MTVDPGDRTAPVRRSNRTGGEQFQTSPRLSSSQRSYRSDPEAFLLRLKERADSLFENGYVVYPTEEIHCFLVTAPPGASRTERRQGQEEPPVEYEVRYLLFTCTCPFYQRQSEGESLTEDGRIIPCKHLQGVPLLVRRTRHWLRDTGQIEAYCALWSHWLKTLSALRLIRVRREERASERNRRRCQGQNIATTTRTDMSSMTTMPKRKGGFSHGNPER